MSEAEREIDDAEWRNPDNWAGIRPFKACFSKRDSRLFVPYYWNGRMSPNTINFGHRFRSPTIPLMWTFIAGVLLAMTLMNR